MEKITDMEYHQKCNNLIFDGILDSRGESNMESYRKICDLLSTYTHVQSMKIARCHRLGGYKAGTNRPIIANFLWFGDVTAILSIKNQLPKGVYIREDIPKVWDDRNRILRPYSYAAKNKELNSYVSKGKLHIDGAVYTCESLDNIPPAIKSEMHHEREDSEKLIYFGPQSDFSNMNYSPFKVDNVTYTSTEQYIQSQKASLFKDDKTELKVMLTQSPYEAKKLGGRVSGFTQNLWEEKAESIAIRGVFEKFRQNNRLKKKIVSI